MCQPEFLCSRSDTRYCRSPCGHSGRLSEVTLTHYRRREVRNSIYRYRKIHIDYRSKFSYRFISFISIIYGNTTFQYPNGPLVLGSTGKKKPPLLILNYCKSPNISCNWVGNKIVNHLSALLQLHLNFRLNIWLQWTGQRQLQDRTRIISVLGFVASYITDVMVCEIMNISQPYCRNVWVIRE